MRLLPALGWLCLTALCILVMAPFLILEGIIHPPRRLW